MENPREKILQPDLNFHSEKKKSSFLHEKVIGTSQREGEWKNKIDNSNCRVLYYAHQYQL